MKHRLLIIDDDTLMLDSTKEFLERHGYLVDTAQSGDQALSLLQTNPLQYSLVITDYRMKGQDGAATVSALTALNPDLYVLVLSGDSSRDAIKLTTRSGARGFIDKSEASTVLLAEIEKWCRKFEQTHLTVASHSDPVETEKKIAQLGLVGRSQSLAEIADICLTLRKRNGPVLILGESGTGKELIARSIHDPQRGSFRAVNCAGFGTNPQLMASFLFGHVKGAFTGAIQDKKGILEDAAGGSVFLDEIYALPLNCQIELLRALQEKTITPVGATREISVKFRLIASAKPNLVDAVKQGTFSLDLFYRISRTIIPVPALKDRPEDIEPLVRHFCTQWAKENNESKTFLARTIPFLEAYPWPGNVRELENLVYSLLDITPESKIAPEHLDATFFQNTPRGTPAPHRVFALKERIDEVEKQHMISVLAVSKTLREAARRMQVSLTTVLRLMKKHSLDAKSHLATPRVDNELKDLLNRNRDS